MKIYFTPFFIYAFFFIGCKHQSASYDSLKQNNSRQDAVYWQSLKQTPWPMYRHDPQLTGRSPYTGPVNGTVIDTLFVSNRGEINSGITIDSDSTMYIGISQDTLDLTAIKYNGTVKWKKHINPAGFIPEIFNVPTLGKNNTLYHTTRGGTFSLNNNGEQIWRYSPIKEANGLVTQVGLDGTIYSISQNGILNAISQAGELLWSLTDDRFSWGSIVTPSFSPDGKTLYVQCNHDANIAALDVETHSIKWTFGWNGTPNAPIVDAQGNIYLLACSVIQSNPVSVDTFYSISSNGAIRWRYPFKYRNQFVDSKFTNYDPTIDINGNIYFATDTLYSLDHDGQLRWKFGLGIDDANYCPLVCDANGTVYVGTLKNNVVAISNSGKQLWKIKIPGVLALGYSPTIVPGRLIYSSWKSNKLFIIE